MRKSITNTLGIIFLIIALIPLLVMVMFVSPITQRSMQDELVRNLDGVVQRQVEHVKSWMDDRKGDARVIAENPFVILATQYKEADKEYSELLQYLDYTKYFEYIRDEYGYKEAIISDKKGIVKVATESKLIGFDISHQDYFQEAIKGNTFVSQIKPSLVPVENEEGELEKGTPTMFVSAPIINKFGSTQSPYRGTGQASDILGIVALRIDVGKINKVMHNTKIGLTGETYLINKDGYMLTESRFTDYLKKKGVIRKRTALEFKVTNPKTGELTKGVGECLKKGEGYDTKGYTDYRGVNVLGFWRWIPEYEWGVVAEIDIEEGYKAAFKLRNTTVTIFMMLAVGVMIFAFFLGKKISRPIRNLTEATKRITATLKESPGSLLSESRRVHVHRNDEIGELAESFNIMAESVAQKTKELAEANNTIKSLESRVLSLESRLKAHDSGLKTHDS